MLSRTIVFAGLVAACQPSAPSVTSLPDRGPLSTQLVAQFTRSAEAWNRGDLDGFMADYASDSATSFIASGHLRRGYDFIRSNYAPRFAPGAARDSLRFEEFDVRPLTPTLALVTARFILYRGGQTTASGPFTLVMERQDGGWKILHDHSSSDPQ